MARMGFDTPTFSADGKAYDDSQYGGYGQRIDPNGKRDANGNPVVLGTGASDAINRYQGMGQAASMRGAYQADFGLANQDRAMNGQDRTTQENALALQRNAAMGNAPSRAAIVGNQAAGQSLGAALGAEAGARPGGLAGAVMGAQQGQAGMQLGAQAGAMAGRSNEMGQAIGGYGQAAGAIRQGDYSLMGLDQGQADAQAQSENAQRQLNDKAQMADEGRAFNVNADEMNRNLTQQQIYAQNYATASAAQNANAERDKQFIGATVSGFGSVVGGASGAGGGGGGGGGSSDATDIATSDARAKQSTYMLSDARAKQEAYDLGVARGLSAGPETRLAPTGITGVRANQNKPTEGPAAVHSFERQDPAAQRYEAEMRDKQHQIGAHQVAVGLSALPANPLYGAGMVGGGANSMAQAANSVAPPGREPVGFTRDVPPPPMQQPMASGSDMRLKQNSRTLSDADAAKLSAKADRMFGAPAAPPRMSDAEAAKLSAKADGMFGGQQAQQQAQLAAPSVGSGLGARAARMQQDIAAQQQAQLDAGPAVKPDMGQALEQGLKPYSYEYKPDFAQREGQGAGEKNVGPMAQDMASNPITGTAVKKGDDGMLYIDMPKVTKLNSAGIGYLAQKVREQGDELSRMKGGR